ncbi:MAG: phosphatidylserine decarboxylase [Gammaproteobacteria bacterium]|nr:MAG: phosphatidylserine decarboxylase [Gammaproteobacteria bacterium]
MKLLAQKMMHRRLATRFIYWLTRVRVPFMKNWMIGKFIREYKVEMDDYVVRDAFSHPTFNSFFVRAIRPECRPFPADERVIGSPADGTIFDFGTIRRDQRFQVKRFEYHLPELLNHRSPWSRTFEGGEYAIIYLAPANYHRIHMPVTGTLMDEHYIPGDFFSVNARTVHHIPHVFARNERLLTVFDTPFGKMALILVGALFVAGIETVWRHSYQDVRKGVKTDFPDITLERGQEMGRFNMGSTVILLFEPGRIRWGDISSDQQIRMGQPIAQASEGD